MSQIGPSLPPGFAAGEEPQEEEATDKIIGPTVPARLMKKAEDKSPPDNSNPDRYGPILPPGFQLQKSPSDKEEEEEEDIVIGPMPSKGKVTEEEDLARRRREVEARSQTMKDKLSGKNEEVSGPKREEWMTELPAEFKPLGIGARKFRTNVQDSGDRSVWTDTPMDRLRKLKEGATGKKEEKKTATLASVVAREKALAEQVECYNKEHRSESLMDMHKRKRKAEEREKKGNPQERRPFDREQDLEVPRSLVTPAKRAALMKDSKQSLDTRFQRGTQSFL